MVANDGIGADFKINGIHEIEKNGTISQMPELLSELTNIQSITGNF